MHPEASLLCLRRHCCKGLCFHCRDETGSRPSGACMSTALSCTAASASSYSCPCSRLITKAQSGTAKCIRKPLYEFWEERRALSVRLSAIALYGAVYLHATCDHLRKRTRREAAEAVGLQTHCRQTDRGLGGNCQERKIGKGLLQPVLRAALS